VVVVVTADRELGWRCRCAAASAARGRSRPSADDDDDAGGVGCDPAVVVAAARERCGGRKKKSRAARMRRLNEEREEEEKEGGGEEHDPVADDDADEGTDATTDVTTTGRDVAAVSAAEDDDYDDDGIPTVEVISPLKFLEDLDLAVHEWLRRREPRHAPIDGGDGADLDVAPFSATATSAGGDGVAAVAPSPVTTVRDLFRLRGRILALESSLRGNISLHRRSTTMGELRKCKGAMRVVISSIVDGGDDDDEDGDGGGLVSSLAWSLSSTISSLDEEEDEDEDDDCESDSTSPPPSSTSSTAERGRSLGRRRQNATSGEGRTPKEESKRLWVQSQRERSRDKRRQDSTPWERLAPKDQERLLLQWGKDRGHNAVRREKTEDRIVLAERLRRQLELIFDRSIEDEKNFDVVRMQTTSIICVMAKDDHLCNNFPEDDAMPWLLS